MLQEFSWLCVKEIPFWVREISFWLREIQFLQREIKIYMRVLVLECTSQVIKIECKIVSK